MIGPAGSENGVSGWVGAFRLSDGQNIWRFQTVAKGDDPGSGTWKNPRNIPLGGGAVWTPFSLDAEKAELFVAVSNPAPDLPAHLRPGENLYTNSIVALNARTGALLWYKQTVPNDSHDWDLTQVSPLFEANVGGRDAKLVATVGKDGMLRTLDRATKQALYETPVTTYRKRQRAGDEQRGSRMPRHSRRRGMERSRVQSDHEDAIHARGGLVRNVPGESR